MSRIDLPAGVATAAGGAAYRAALALEIGFPSPVRLTDAGSSLTIGADTYTNGDLSISGLDVGGDGTISVRVSNATNAISTPDLATGAIGVTLTVYGVYWSSAGVQLSPVALFVGKVTTVDWDTVSATLNASMTSLTRHGMVGRVVSRLCVNTFKGDRCAYAGGVTSCDHTYATCTALSNTAKFNGYPTMPQVGTIFRYRIVREAPASTHTGTIVRRVVKPPTTPAGHQVRPRLWRGDDPSRPHPIIRRG